MPPKHEQFGLKNGCSRQTGGTPRGRDLAQHERQEPRSGVGTRGPREGATLSKLMLSICQAKEMTREEWKQGKRSSKLRT